MKCRQVVQLVVFSLVFSLLSACSAFRVRQTDIQQGNVVTQTKIDQLHKGMTPEQVTYVLGSPVLRSTLDRNVWTYVYSFQRGGKGQIQKQHLNVHFKDGQLSSVSGQYYPIHS